MQEKCKQIQEEKILVPNYKIGIELAHYLKNSKKSIFVDNKVLCYEKNKKINYLIEKEHKLKKIDLEPLKLEKHNIQKINNIKKIKKISEKYKYIAVDNELKSIFQDEFGYIECEKYSESKEGKRWLQIYNLKTAICELEKLKALDILKKNKEYTYEFFSYIETNYSQIEVKDIYKSFFKEEPIFFPKNLDERFYDALFINVIEKEKMIIDKALIKYIEEEVLYIGKEAFYGAKHQIIYNPKFEKYPEFEKLKIKIKTNEESYYKEKQIKNKLFSKIYATQKGLYSNESNFYSNYKRYLINLLYKICIQKENINFEDKFKIDSEFYKLLIKTQKIIANFDAFLTEKTPKNIKKDVFFNQIRWDFYSLESKIIIDIVTSKTNLEEYYAKKKYALTDYWIITENQILNIKQEKELEKTNEKQFILEDDLLSWNNVIFDTK